MIKNIFILSFALPFLILCVISTQTEAQNFIGLRGGMTYSFMGPGFEGQYGDRVGFSLGLGSQIELRPNFYFNPELNYVRKNFLFYDPVFLDNRLFDTDLLVGLNYLDVPLYFGYGVFTEEEGSADMFIMFYGGVHFNWLMSQDNRFRGDPSFTGSQVNIESFEEIRQTNWGMGLGVGVGYNRWYFDIRYYFGFTSLFTFDMIDDVTNTITLSVGYRLQTN